MRTEKFKNLFGFGQKSNIKAGDGKDKGRFPFYTSSPKLTKWIDKEQHFDEALIFGTGGLASIHFSNEPFSTSTDCLVAITTNKEIKTKYVYYYLFGNIHLLERGFKGAGLKHISKKYIENLDIPILPIETQNKIVAILDKSTTLITKREQSIVILDELLRATFIDMFGDPCQSSKISKRISLGELGNWKSGGTPSRANQDYFKGNIPWVTSGELNDMFISEAKEKITKKALDSSNAKFIEVGSLLLGMYDTAALKSSITAKELTCNQAIAYARLDDTLCDAKFVYYNIQLGKDFFKSQQRGVRQQNLNLSMIKAIKILFPSLNEQKVFSKFAEKTYSQKQGLVENQTQLQNLSNAIIQNVFNGRLNFNVDFELDALIKEIDLQKKENDLSKIAGDIAYLQRLVDKLNNQEFKEKDLYDKAKHSVFQLMAERQEDRKVVQVYDENSKSLKLALK